MQMRIKKVSNPKRVLLVVFVFTLIATIAFLMPSTSIPKIKIDTPIELDKLVHVGIHFVLAFCWLFYYALRNSKMKFSNVLYIALACVFYGILIEMLQGTTKTRSSDLADVCANMIGTGLGVLGFLVLKCKILMKA